MATSAQRAAGDALRNVQEYAHSMKVHRRQCILLGSFLEKAFANPSSSQGSPEAGQQWDEALTNLQNHLATWSELDIVQSYLQSDQIRVEIDKLYGELKWCGLQVEDSSLRLNESRRQDEDDLLGVLRTISSDQRRMDHVKNQPISHVRLFIKRLQSALKGPQVSGTFRTELETALKFLYKNANVRIATPDLTAQIISINPEPFTSNPDYQAYSGEWMADDRVVLKAIRRVRYDTASAKRFRRDTAAFFSMRHPNIVRIYGSYLNEVLGCCVVAPVVANVNVLSYLEQHPDAVVLSWLNDVAVALQYLHAWDPPVVYGCLRAENVLVKNSGRGVLISDFGMFQLSRQPLKSVDEHRRWCAPEVVRAARGNDHPEILKSACSKQSDVYSLGIVMFEIFTSEIPFYHIQDEEFLEPEILHGTRPSMSNDLKARATQRGWTAELHALMKQCWDADPSERPSAGHVGGKIVSSAAYVSSLDKSPDMRSQESSSSSETVSDFSSDPRSRHWSAQSPRTPNSGRFTLSASPVIVPAKSSAGSPNDIFSGQVFAEPPPIELDSAHIERHVNGEALRKFSVLSTQTEYDEHDDPRSSFSDDSEAESHLGQGENKAYERMPKLKGPSLSTSKRRGSGDRFGIIMGRMTVDGRIDQNWAGVANMEAVREITRRPHRLTQVTAVEHLVEREAKFCADRTDDYFAQRLRAEPSILGPVRLENFLSNVFEDSRTVRLLNEHFKNALQASSDIGNIGLMRFSLLCKEAASQFCIVYPEYVRHLPEVQRLIAGELEQNERFTILMNEKVRGGSTTLKDALNNYLCAPVHHLDHHPRTLELIISEMKTDEPEIPVIQEAHREMIRAVNLVHLAAWQQNEEQKAWKDFVSQEIIKPMSKPDVNRQTLIFELISEERDYVKKLMQLLKVLQRINFQIINLRRREDAATQEVIKALIAVVNDLLRFHCQLLDNLLTVQRAEHPTIAAFVSVCGIDQIPWHSLYDHRFGNSYKKLTDIIQGSNVRMGIFKRVTQEIIGQETDFMTILRTPSLHLRTFVDVLRKIMEATPEAVDDRNVISEIFPRLWDISQQAEVKTSMSKERARLTSLSAALDFSKYPAIESDVSISSSKRVLLMSGEIWMSKRDPFSGHMGNEQRFAVLLDNYLIFTSRSDTHGIIRLEVQERPVPLDLVHFDFTDLPFPNPLGSSLPCAAVHFIGRGQETMYLYTDSQETMRAWKSKLQEALAARTAASERDKIVNVVPLHKFPWTPSCSAEFSFGNQRITAVSAYEGSTAGIWLFQSAEGNPRHATDLHGIKKMTVMSELGIILILAETSLFWFRLDDFMKGKTHTRQTLDDAVHFYSMGALGSRSFLIISAIRKGKAILRFFEAAENGKSSKLLTLKGKAGPFNLVTECEPAYPVKNIYFLKSSFIFVSDSFQLVNFTGAQQLKEVVASKKRQTLPLPEDPLTDLAERCRSSVPVALHRIDKDFILCFKEFAVYINQNGQLSSRVVEWASKDVHSVVFRDPYMLVLGSSTVEVRQIASGVLEQLHAFPGRVQLSWEGRQDIGSRLLNVHVLVGATSQGGAGSEQWYSLDSTTACTLHRLQLPG